MAFANQPTGGGKSMLLHALANAVDRTVFWISITYLVLRFNGETELLVEILFEFIKEYQPALVLMEEIDVIGRKKAVEENDFERRLKSEFLRQLDALLDQPDNRVAFVATTNAPWELDATFLRRFERKILIPLPSEEDRFQLVSERLRGALSLSENQLRGLAKCTRGFSNFEILNLINEVFIESCQLEGVQLSDVSFRKKFKSYSPAVSPKVMNHFIRHLKKIGDNEQLKEIDEDLYESSTCDYIV